MRMKVGWLRLSFVSAMLVFAFHAPGQERPRTVEQPSPSPPQDSAEEVLRVNTRAVFIDTLVKDKRTGEPVQHLTREDFQVFDNGKLRPLSYFTRDGEGDKRPLALLFVLAPLDDGAFKSLRSPEVVNSLVNALAKLPAADEVALMLVWRDGTTHMLSELTRDRAKVTSALNLLPKRDQIKRAVRPPKVIQEAALASVLLRPRSQSRVVLVTDSVFLITHAERDEMIRNLIRSNVTFNALITGTDPFFAAFSPLLKPAEDGLGASWYDVPQYWARQTGGDYARVHKKKDYGPALEKLIGTVTARYSLGFTLGENDVDDGQMRRLEVRVKARDAQGKERKVETHARTGYYVRSN